MTCSFCAKQSVFLLFMLQENTQIITINELLHDKFKIKKDNKEL